MRRIGRAALTAGLFCVGSATAPRAGEDAPGPVAPRQTAASTDSALVPLAWMAGCWGAARDGVEMEERWTAPKGGILLGVHRDVFASGRVFFEFLRIERRPDGVFYVAQPRGLAPTEFRLIESAGRRAVFSNPEHDFPQRILYWLDDAGALHARIEGDEDGEVKSAEWTWPRVPCDSR